MESFVSSDNSCPSNTDPIVSDQVEYSKIFDFNLKTCYQSVPHLKKKGILNSDATKVISLV